MLPRLFRALFKHKKKINPRKTVRLRESFNKSIFIIQIKKAQTFHFCINSTKRLRLSILPPLNIERLVIPILFGTDHVHVGAFDIAVGREICSSGYGSRWGSKLLPLVTTVDGEVGEEPRVFVDENVRNREWRLILHPIVTRWRNHRSRRGEMERRGNEMERRRESQSPQNTTRVQENTSLISPN